MANSSLQQIIVIILCALVLIIIVFLGWQNLKLYKEKGKLKAQDKKLKEMASRENDKYQDFTENHLYK